MKTAPSSPAPPSHPGRRSSFRQSLKKQFTSSLCGSLFLLTASLGFGFSGGDGSAEDPYQVSIQADLEAINQNLSACYVLVQDLDLSDTSYTTALIAPDLDNSNYYIFDGSSFTGVLDGNGHKITGLTIHGGNNTTDHVGLFGSIGGSGRIENLGLVNCTASGDFCTGILAGSNSGTVTNTYSTGAVTTRNYCSGGLVGRNFGVIISSYSLASVSNGLSYIGGLVGDNGGGEIYYSYAAGAVNSPGWHVAGLAGDNHDGVLMHCYSTGQVTGGSFGDTGALTAGDGQVISCYFLDTAGIDNGLGTPLSAAEMRESSSYDDWDFTNLQTGLVGKWYLPADSMPLCWWQYEPIYRMPRFIGQSLADAQAALEGAGFLTGEVVSFLSFSVPAGHVLDISARQGALYMDTTPPVNLYVSQGSKADGSAAHPYEVSSKLDLDAVNDHLDANYVLLRDIDFSAYSYNRAVIAGDTDDTNFEYDGVAFNGRFDGNHFALSHLQIDGKLFCGLFGKIQANAKIKNLNIVQAAIRGKHYTGGLAGWNVGGMITSCSITGMITGVTTLSSDSDRVGGLAGSNEGRILKCSSTVEVTGDDYVGGVAGSNLGGISNCVYHGTVRGDDYVGGVAGGDIFGYILNSYSTGSVSSGGFGIGGVAGYTQGGRIVNCYSTASVPSRGNSGGVVGWNSGGSIISSYFLDSVGSNNGLGVALSDLQMQTQASFAGWDFVNASADGTSQLWEMSAETGYPELVFFSDYEPVMLQGQGSLANPYRLHDANELGAMVHYDEDACYLLEDHIDLSGIQWSTSICPEFAGVLDGNDFAIQNFTASVGNFHAGILGIVLPEGEVTDLRIENFHIEGGRYAGGLAGYNYGRISNCYTLGNIVSTGPHVGGLVGWNCDGGILEGCTSAGVVSGGDFTGGLVGENGGTVTHCHSTNGVTGVSYVGGLVGKNMYDIFQSYSTGAVEGGFSVGGLVGNNNGSIKTSYSKGAVGSSGSYIGGFVGWNGGGIETSWSTGAVTSSGSRIGGFVGWNRYTYIRNSYSTGSVTGDDYVGGFVGSNEDSYITNCYSVGLVEGRGYYTGGMVGYVWGSDPIRACFWDPSLSGRLSSSGGTALAEGELGDQLTFTNAGWDFLDETRNGTNAIWAMGDLPGGSPGARAPVLFWSLGLPVTTGSATELTTTSATLHGTVNANGLATTAWFEYGSTIDYGSTAEVTLSPDDGTSPQEVSAVIEGLLPGQTYHYRLVASNSAGTALGLDRMFVTEGVSGDYIYTIAGSTAIITAYTGTGGAVAIPDVLNGLPVTGIGDRAFYNKASVTSVTLPASVTNIGERAFSYCTGLKTALYLGNSPTMGLYVFYPTASGFTVYCLSDMSGFTSPTWQGYPTVAMSDPGIITHPASVTTVSGSIVTLTVTAIGTEPLTYQWYQGTSGTTINPVGSNSASFTSPPLTAATSYWVNVTNAANPTGENSNSATVMVYPPLLVTTGPATWDTSSTVTLTGTVNPNGLATTARFEYGPSTAYGTVKTVTLSPNDGSSALSVAVKLGTLPAGTTYHYRLTATNVGGTAPGADRVFMTERIAGNYKYTTADNMAIITGYTGPGGAVVIPDVLNGLAVAGIGYQAFYNKTTLTSVTLPASVTSIGSSAFASCSKLTRMGFSGNAPTMGTGVFTGTATGFTVYYLSGKSGFTSPIWQGYPAVAMSDPGIITHPASAAVASGDATTLSVTVVGTDPLSYQWYQGEPGDTTTTVGTNSSFFTTPALTSSTTYWVRVINAANPTGVNSAAATIGVAPPPHVTTGPATWDAGVYVALTGTVNPNGFATTAQFEYGETSAYGHTRFASLWPNDSSTGDVYVSSGLVGLPFGTAYHYRLTATNAGGTTTGDDHIFITERVSGDYKYITADDSATITGYTGAGGAVTIPGTINGLTVVGIGYRAFYQKATLTSVTIPASVTSIGSSAFNNCDLLTSAIFLGDAPVLGTAVFFSWYFGGVTVFYADGQEGFTTPTWNGYPAALLKDAARIHGVVTDTTSSPRAGIKVDCQRDGWFGHAFTTAAGEYELLVLPGYPYALEFDPTDAGSYARRRIEFQVPSPGDYEKNIILKDGITISGTITDRGTAAPLGGIRVGCWNDDEELWVGSSTDGEGHYVLRNLPKGWSEVSAHPEHTYAGEGVDREFLEDSVVDFALDVEATISGVVYDAVTSAPVSDVHIICWNEASSIWADTYSDEQGEFSLRGLPAGIAEVSARPDPGIGHGGRYFGWSNRNVRLSTGQNFDCCLFLLEEAALISGHVTDGPAGGVPVPGVRIHASNMFFTLAEADTDASGYYELRLPVGAHEVEIDRDESDYQSFARTVHVTSPADHQTIDFTTYDGTTAATISGRITNGGGYPIDSDARLLVAAFNAGADIGIDFLYSFTNLVGSGGAAGLGSTYSLIAPPNAEFDLYLVIMQDSGGGETAVVRKCRSSVMAGAAGTITPNQDLNYDSEGGSITGTVTANGSPLANAEVFLKHVGGAFWGFARSDSSGAYRFDNVPAGEFTVQAAHWDYGRSPAVAFSGVAEGGMLDEVNMNITVNYVALGIHGVGAGVASIFFDTVADGDYTIEISGDLANWFPVQTKRGDGSVMTWTDPAATTPARFYRVFHQ